MDILKREGTAMALEQAQADIDTLRAKHTEWTQQRDMLVEKRSTLEATAGTAALAGQSTTKLADQLSRLTSEIGIANQALAVLDTHIAAATGVLSLARIADVRAQAVAKFEEAAALEAAIEPHLEAIEAITGLRYTHQHSVSDRLQEEAHRLLSQSSYLEGLLANDAYAALLAQRDTAPTDVDNAIHRFQYPQTYQEVQT